MSAPPVPPRPYDLNANATPRTDPNSTHRTDPNLPPPVPPLPPDVRLQNERYNTPSPYEYEYEYESPPRFENPMIAPRPHRLDASIPANVSPSLAWIGFGLGGGD
ncbi:hypothetical protein CVT26_010293 [Gymnopilus dilepis]|uniref:Uncharacterized protein n=1 Tax=Gymnopilus dilepis TaxID=231916 RepID=A0A409Y0Z9_9AGAR|nr:hypothetical protein CVT26_010293 [Gymnopilus dilepis]